MLKDIWIKEVIIQEIIINEKHFQKYWSSAWIFQNNNNIS